MCEGEGVAGQRRGQDTRNEGKGVERSNESNVGGTSIGDTYEGARQSKCDEVESLKFKNLHKNH